MIYGKQFLANDPVLGIHHMMSILRGERRRRGSTIYMLVRTFNVGSSDFFLPVGSIELGSNESWHVACLAEGVTGAIN